MKVQPAPAFVAVIACVVFRLVAASLLTVSVQAADPALGDKSHKDMNAGGIISASRAKNRAHSSRNARLSR